MHPKATGRRRFLKNSAALAGFSLAPAGSLLLPSSASGEPVTAAPGAVEVEDLKRPRRGPLRPTLSLRDDRAGYRGRESSRHRAAAAESVSARRPHAASRFDRNYHAFVASLHNAAFLRHPGHQPRGTKAPDPRHGRAPVGVHAGRTEAPAVRVANLLPRMQRQTVPTRMGERSTPHTAAPRAANGRAFRSRCCSERQGSRTRRSGSSRKVLTTGNTPRACRFRRHWMMCSSRTAKTVSPCVRTTVFRCG